MNKNLILSILGIVVVLGLGFIIIKVNNKVVDQGNSISLPAQLYFYKEQKTDRGFYDRTSIKMIIDGDKISGEVKNLPAEKDSKVGTFDGTIGALDETTGEYTADVWWNSMAEGMSVKEQLLILFNTDKAKIGFGEMIDRGDGVYVYKDTMNLSWIEMPSVDRATFDASVSQVKPIPTAQFGESVTLKLGEHASFPDDLYVTLKQINDSRCKPDVQCIWAGELSPVLSVGNGNYDVTSADITLGTLKNKSVNSNGYTFSLKSGTTTSATITVEYIK